MHYRTRAPRTLSVAEVLAARSLPPLKLDRGSTCTSLRSAAVGPIAGNKSKMPIAAPKPTAVIATDAGDAFGPFASIATTRPVEIVGGKQ